MSEYHLQISTIEEQYDPAKVSQRIADGYKEVRRFKKFIFEKVEVFKGIWDYEPVSKDFVEYRRVDEAGNFWTDKKIEEVASAL